MKSFLPFWVLVGLLAALCGACSRPISVQPNPVALYTSTPTATATPTSTSSATATSTSTQTLTSTSTSTSTPTSTATATPTATFTAVFTATRTFTPTVTSTATATSTVTFTPTDTDTATPTDTSTDTPTPTDTPVSTDTPTVTDTPGVVCVTTPVAPNFYTEVELVGVGGTPGGTNDDCPIAEDVGTISSGNAVVISGSMSSNGGGGYDLTKDQDFYKFTVGTAGVYTFTVECFSTGSDANALDIAIFDAGCGYLYDPGANQPAAGIVSPPLVPGDVYYLNILGYDGIAPMPYKLTIAPP